jgi:hypothetical protein
MIVYLILYLICIIYVILSSEHTIKQKLQLIGIVTLGLLSRIITYHIVVFCIENIVVISIVYFLIGAYIYLFDK